MDRLTNSTSASGNTAPDLETYGFDANHNRTAKNQFVYTNALGDQLTAYTAPSGNTSLSYNAQGQATSVGSSTYSYNQDQQIKEAVTPNGTSKYFYDGAGRRVAKEVNGTRSEYLLMGSEVLKTYENGAPKAEYFLGLGRHGIKTNNAWKYYLTDGLGSTVSLTDDTGSTVAAYDYDDYGETSQIAGSTSVYNPFLYTGQEWDAELGMYNLRARHYSPSLGRFIARDPIGHAGGSNLYAYVGNNPINAVDPSGLDATIVTQRLVSMRGVGPHWVYDTATYKDAASFLAAVDSATSITAIILSGHGATNFAGISYDPMSSDGFISEEHLGKISISFRAGDRYRTLDSLNLKAKGLKAIFLDSCNTAGGHRDPVKKARSQSAIKGYVKQHWGPGRVAPASWYPEAGDENIARYLHDALGVDVVGNSGIHWTGWLDAGLNEPPVRY